MTAYNTLIALFNLGGMVFLLMAMLWGFFNRQTQDSHRDFWGAYTLAAAFGSALLLLRALFWIGSPLPHIESLTAGLAAAAAVMLILGSTVYIVSPLGKKDLIEQFRKLRA